MKMNKKALFGFAKRYISYIIIAAVTLAYAGISLTSGAKTADLYLLEKMAIAIILAVSLGMVVGFLGELSLGHAGFMCVGAYIGCFFANFMQSSFSSPIYGALPLTLCFIILWCAHLWPNHTLQRG